MAQHNEKGKEGEALARRFLVNKGYKILESNWQLRKFELDIIALQNELLVVVEVKTRSTTFAGHPSEAVTPAKQKQIIAATNAYIDQKNLENEVRFDIIAVTGQGHNILIDHIEDAFFPQA